MSLGQKNNPYAPPSFTPVNPDARPSVRTQLIHGTIIRSIGLLCFVGALLCILIPDGMNWMAGPFIMAVYSLRGLNLTRPCPPSHSEMIKLVAALFLTMLLASDALATTGWDHYSVDIRDRFRIHEERGIGSVHRIDSDGKQVDPALCSILGLDQSVILYGRPPNYCLTKTHLLVRYPHSGKNSDVRNYFAIELDGENVLGPLTAAELEDRNFETVAKIKWVTPWTAADKFQWVYSGVLVGLAIMLIVFVIGAVKAVMWCVGGSGVSKIRGDATIDA